jgi:hypothetical protein
MIGGSFYPLAADPIPDTDGAQPSASPAAMLEVEIADLISATFNLSAQSDGRTGKRIDWDQTRGSQQLADVENEVDGASTLTTDTAVEFNAPGHQRRAWDADIKIYDPEKLAVLASPQMRPSVIIIGVLLLALGMAWFGGGWSSHHFVRAVPSSVAIDQKVASRDSGQPNSALPPGTVEPPTPNVPTGKIDGPTAKEPDVRRVSPRNAVPSLGDVKRAAVPPHNTASPSASAAVHHRPKSLSTPFPETKPTTIDGWVVREVANGTAVLQGPNGVWTASRGDTVPGLGTVDSIVLWGNRWIVSTSKGLITPR